ncbi:MAG: tyrosine-type recombinase/integrase [Calditrichaeota bacterium]|nr:tyrosine-type recombinase/integrase [Calditrichota bacterium]
MLPSHLTLFENHLRLEGRAPSTIKGYLRDTADFFRIIGLEDPEKLTLDHVQRWDDHIAKKNKPATRARYRNSIRSFIGYGQTHGFIPDIGGGLKPIFVPQHMPKMPTREEWLMIMDAHKLDAPHPIEFRDCAVICFLGLVGARRSEVALVNMGDISLYKTSFQVILTSPKRNGQRRIVNFGDISKPRDIAAAYFGRYYTHRLQDLGGHRSQRALKAPLFSQSEDKTKRLFDESFNVIVSRAAKRATAGVRPLNFITPHTMRHFFATYCAVNGMRIEVIQKYMGHASVVTTERYIHLAEIATGDQARELGPSAGLKANNDLYLGSAEHQQNYFKTLIPQSQQ